MSVSRLWRVSGYGAGAASPMVGGVGVPPNATLGDRGVCQWTSIRASFTVSLLLLLLLGSREGSADAARELRRGVVLAGCCRFLERCGTAFSTLLKSGFSLLAWKIMLKKS